MPSGIQGFLESIFGLGFPCVDLSAAKYNRSNVERKHSSLIHEALRIRREVKAIFPYPTEVHFVFENVSSMDRSARDQITELVGVKPWKLNPPEALPFSRPRFTWCSFARQDLPGFVWLDRGPYFELVTTGGAVALGQWLRPVWSWPGEGEGARFPTFIKAIVRAAPPPVPVGLDRCDDDTIGRWTADQYRFPPHQYRACFVLWKGERWRLLDSTERELLMGFGWNHTQCCWGAGWIKTDPRGHEDARLSLIGGSFSTINFGLVLACSFSWKPHEFSVQHLIQRLGLAPGHAVRWGVEAPIAKELI